MCALVVCAGAVYAAGGASDLDPASGRAFDQRERDQMQQAAQEAADRARAYHLQSEQRNADAKRAAQQVEGLAMLFRGAHGQVAEAEDKLMQTSRAARVARVALAQRQGRLVELVAGLQRMSRRPTMLVVVRPGTTSDVAHVRSALVGLQQLADAETRALGALVARVRTENARIQTALSALRAAEAGLTRQQLVYGAQMRRARNLGANFEGRSRVAGIESARLMEEVAEMDGRASLAAADRGVAMRLDTMARPVARPGAPSPAQRLSFRYRLPVAGDVLTGFGEATRSGIRTRGIIMAVRPRAPVLAPAPGRIVYAAPFLDYGDVVIIDHGNGLTSVLTGLGGIDVGRGERVEGGTPIGRAAAGQARIGLEARYRGHPANVTMLLSGA